MALQVSFRTAAGGESELNASSKGEPEVIRDYAKAAKAEWRYGRPDYTAVNKMYFQDRKSKPYEGSAEEMITKIVLNWETEVSHVANIKEWTTVDVANFFINVNASTKYDAQFLSDRGLMNVVLQEFAKGYSAKKNTIESASKLFADAFPDGLAWECVEVYSGAPKMNLQCRQFGKFTGKFTDTDGNEYIGDGRVVEVFMNITVTLSESNQITAMEIYGCPSELTTPMMKCPMKEKPKPPPTSAVGCCAPRTEPSVAG